MTFQPATRLTEQIADHLAHQIISAELAPGERIPEVKVARGLGVSRGSVREALLILEARRLIDILPRRGAIVCALNADEVEPLCELSAEILSYYFRRLAASVDGREEALAPLREALDAIEETIDVGDRTQFVQAKVSFVQAGYSQLADPFVTSSLESLLPVGARLAHLVAGHADHDARDALRLGKAVMCAMLERNDTRINELVHAHYRRLAELASECLLGTAREPLRRSA
ncbi:MAG: GntR family transcriptional regulator [Pseudomonadaceae bacterium]|nr:GntR family transcriptional regulator [Pseudomonadaceae bacterium]